MEKPGTPVPEAEIDVEELIRRIESGEDIHVLDVRAAFRLQNGTIDVVPGDRFHNVTGSQVFAAEDPASLGLPRDAPIVVVCGKGLDSRLVSDHLRAAGYPTASVAGGMNAWMGLVVPRELTPPPGCDRLVQFDRIGKGALGYVIVSGGEAVVVDAPRNTRPFLDVVRDAKARVVGVADTHAHADYISGGPGLAKELGVPYWLHPADSFYPYDGTPGRLAFEAAEDGRSIPVGGARLTVEHTPGHTEGSVCYRLGDDAVMTGDFVFVGSIGRPDLGGKAEAWTAVLWESLERARSRWPDGIRVLPAHYAADAERNSDRSVGKPFGALGPGNRPLTIGDRAKFTEWVLDRTGEFPEAYRRIKAINVALELPSAGRMDELEAGRNQCALG